MPEWLPWALAIVVAVAAGWAWNSWRHRAGRSGTGPAATRRPGRPSRGPGRQGAPPRPRDAEPAERTGETPRPGEIWWADVPYEDGTGSKVRPCLVLRADRRGADVLKITSQDKSDRDDHVRIPTRSWDASADHDSFLDVSEPIRVTAAAFADRAGTCDPTLWRQVRKLPHLAA
ncbi:type II toxin-antitoxin system PemK/MazF family toxin [Micromonospora siamensis]|uniref:PemK-like, MazF-like toxin of type II toxin-antitoxin system n=2 Tax=Micromonospora siamensis TaxID=299152 RepID=A0A1C5HKR5_9ACTN|nr:PemK-like, MazF-like toxin of type II toxin-antitoxin system [Micromonospora siamensis]